MDTNPYLDALRRVTAGRTATFAELARLAGRPAAARAAGRAIASVPTADPRPWHRVVQSDGGLAPDPARADVQLERLRVEGARPRDGEDVRSWARRRRARFVGHWRSRALYELDDARLAALDPSRVEALRDEEQSLERGFYFAPPPPVARSPLPRFERAARVELGPDLRTAAQRRADLERCESPAEIEADFAATEADQLRTEREARAARRRAKAESEAESEATAVAHGKRSRSGAAAAGGSRAKKPGSPRAAPSKRKPAPASSSRVRRT